MLDPSTPLSKALRTTKEHLRRLEELGMKTVSDFLLYFPMRYTDQREVGRIIDIRPDQVNVVRGVLESIKNSPAWGGRMPITNGVVRDETGSVEAVWFRQPYLGRTLKAGSEVMVSGKVKYRPRKRVFSFQNPTIEVIRAAQVHTARIVPVYHETDLAAEKKGKLSSKWLREKLFTLLPFTEFFPEYMPEEILKTYGLVPLQQAIKHVHFPETEEELSQGKHRLAFDELFLLQLAALKRRHYFRKIAADEKKQIPPNWELVKSFTASLPWPLTNAQKKATYEILKDLEKPFPMSRLLEGDVGSGKTVVAAAAILQAIKNGWQTCFLAPTEILARQHLLTLSKMLSPFDIQPVLLVGSTSAKEKKQTAQELVSGNIPLTVGTHALLQEHIGFAKLGLAVVDEQHRFGVRQREKLKTFGSPHVLSMTATPIPRTLALILYGDQDLSLLDEMPAGRQKIVTRIVPENKRTEAYRWIENAIEKGRQAFIIFPLIEESDLIEAKAATQEFERLKREVFPNISIGLLHGQLPAKEKEQTMKMFAQGMYSILVSTAVVEVGVDVPNATIMLIEAADRFGLAQLHQFRGRVGRGSDQSYCFLFPASVSPNSLKRLNALVNHHSGFQLAEIDLQLRGPGEVYGTAQSGIPDLRMANLSDSTTIKQAREAAEHMIAIDPELKKYPELEKKIAEQENIAIDY